jgi:hypothetical protein
MSADWIAALIIGFMLLVVVVDSLLIAFRAWEGRQRGGVEDTPTGGAADEDEGTGRRAA